MSSKRARLFWLFAASVLAGAAARGADPSGAIPAGTIIVKGAWSSAAGSASALPENGTVADGRYDNAYFGLRYAMGADWTQRYSGPPPSDSGYYVLAQIEPREAARNGSSGHLLIAAQDLFFTAAPIRSALDLIRYYQEHLGSDYRVERAAGAFRMANRDFVRLDYLSPAAGLHWHVFATEIRCHVVQFVFTAADARAMQQLLENVNSMQQPVAGAPLCIKDFANPETVLEREEPVFSETRFNPVPVRFVIDRQGKVNHIHFLSAFPEQAKNISDALSQWRFKPYLLDGKAVEVETGLFFGRSPHAGASAMR